MQNTFFDEKNNATLYPYISDVYLLQLLKILPKDWIVTETSLALEAYHNIPSNTVFQTNPGNTDRDPNGWQVHPSGHFFMDIGTA